MDPREDGVAVTPPFGHGVEERRKVLLGNVRGLPLSSQLFDEKALPRHTLLALDDMAVGLGQIESLLRELVHGALPTMMVAEDRAAPCS
jgi:hypothetical protein